jgi:hypothetical protein
MSDTALFNRRLFRRMTGAAARAKVGELAVVLMM